MPRYEIVFRFDETDPEVARRMFGEVKELIRYSDGNYKERRFVRKAGRQGVTGRLMLVEKPRLPLIETIDPGTGKEPL